MSEPARSEVTIAGAALHKSGEALANKFLAIRVAGRICALRLPEISGLVADKKIVRMPSHEPALRGVAGFRGLILPIYDLQALCGFSPLATSRWLAIASAAPIAFAFESFERLIGADADDELRPLASHEMGGGAQYVLQTREFFGPVFHLPFFIDALASRARVAPNSEFSA